MDEQKGLDFAGQLFELIPLYASSPHSKVKNAYFNNLNEFLVEFGQYKEPKDETVIEWQRILAPVLSALQNIMFKDAWGLILSLSANLISVTREYPKAFSLELVTQIVAFRDDPVYDSVFPFKDELNLSLVCACRAYGLKEFLQSFPLNIETGSPKRPYLLPTFAEALSDNSKPIDFHYFVTELIELSGRLAVRTCKVKQSKREIEAKVFETLVLQIWTLLPFVARPIPSNLKAGLELFSPIALSILEDPKGKMVVQGVSLDLDFRYLVCNFYTELIKLIDASYEQDTSDSENLTNMNVVKAYVNKFLTALCKQFAPNGEESNEDEKIESREIQAFKNLISAFLQVAEYENIKSYFMHLLKTVSTTPSVKQLDLIHVFIPRLLKPDYELDQQPLNLLQRLLMTYLTESAPFQKRSYRLLNEILSHMSDSMDVAPFTKQLFSEEVVSECIPNKGRIELLCNLAELTDESHAFMADIVGEMMVCCKEPSEKIRNAAFDGIIRLGRVCKRAGEANGESLDDTEMNMDDEENNDLGFKQFLMMVMAGLAATTSSMQSASISCLARIVFEFKDAFSPALVHEMMESVLLTVSSPQKEVVKAALGFIKVVVVSSPPETFEDMLESVVCSSHSVDWYSNSRSPPSWSILALTNHISS